MILYLSLFMDPFSLLSDKVTSTSSWSPSSWTPSSRSIKINFQFGILSSPGLLLTLPAPWIIPHCLTPTIVSISIISFLLFGDNNRMWQNGMKLCQGSIRLSDRKILFTRGHGIGSYRHSTRVMVQEAFGQRTQTLGLNVGWFCVEHRVGLMIFVGSFQLQIFCDSMTTFLKVFLKVLIIFMYSLRLL